MRFLRFFVNDGTVHLGVRLGENVFDITTAARSLRNEEITSPLAFMGEQGSVRLNDLIATTRRDLVPDAIRAGAGLSLDAPLRDSRKIFALAGNYRKHVLESGFAAVEDEAQITPQLFCKLPTNINAPGSPIVIRSSNTFLDWELELAVVIGRHGKNISLEQASSFVFGYTIINDVSERRFNATISNRQAREFDPFFDWLIGKWFDGAAPLGPELVTSDEITDPQNLSIRLWVNGELMQDGNTAQMIHGIPRVLSYISTVITLEPGDIVAMGTPDGVGMARKIRLKPGDVMRGEISGLGVLETPVVSEGLDEVSFSNASQSAAHRKE